MTAEKRHVKISISIWSNMSNQADIGIEALKSDQTSAQPPSSSLYEASLSGRSGLSTSFATRSSARPDKEVRAKQSSYPCSHTFTKKHSSGRGMRQYVTSNRLEGTAGNESHGCSRISWDWMYQSTSEELRLKWKLTLDLVREQDRNLKIIFSGRENRKDKIRKRCILQIVWSALRASR